MKLLFEIELIKWWMFCTFIIYSYDTKRFKIFCVSHFCILTQGIAFPDFKEFCQFLNSLDDFALALRIYTYADHPISEGKSCSPDSKRSDWPMWLGNWFCVIVEKMVVLRKRVVIMYVDMD